MKQKDLVYLLLAVVILLVAGYVGYTQLMPQRAATKTVEVEKVGAIPDSLDAAGLEILGNSTKVRDYSSPVDLNNLKNPAVFGPRTK